MLLFQKREGIGANPFVKTVGGSGFDGHSGVHKTRKNKNLLIGWTTSEDATTAANLIQFNRYGGIDWQKYWSSTGTDEGKKVTSDADGNIYVVCDTTSFGPGTQNVLVMKLAPNAGSIIWQTVWGVASESMEGTGVTVDKYGNVYISCQKLSGTYDPFLVKLNNSGVIQWQKTLSDGNDNQFGPTDVVNNGTEIYMSGWTNEPLGDADYKLVLFKFDSSGNLLWQRMASSSTSTVDDRSNNIDIDSQGNVILSGRTRETDPSDEPWDAILLKFDGDGNLLWQKLIGEGAVNEVGNASFVDVDDNVYVGARSTTQVGDTANDAEVLKYSPTGTLLWKRKLSGAENDRPIRGFSDANFYYITGYTDTHTSGAHVDIMIFRFPTDGTGAGTYGAYTYSTSTITEGAGSLNITTPSYATSNVSFTVSTPTFSLSNGTLTLTDHT